MAVVAQTGTPLDVSFTHDLPETYPNWLPVDTRLTPLGDEVRLMTHLHGGFVAADSDGNPAVTPDGFGPGETQNVHYTNQLPQMPASLLWFHDHGLGTTRLNVFAGLAAAYILRDQLDTGHEPNPIGIPGGAYEVPLVIQDRLFNPDGTFLYPTSEHPWRDMDRRVLRRHDARERQGLAVPRRRATHVPVPGPERMQRADPDPRRRRPAALWQIGAEGGMWDVPVRVKQPRVGSGRAGRRARRLQQVRRSDAGVEEPQPEEAGRDAGAVAAAGDADPGRDDRDPSGPDLDPVEPARARRPTCPTRSRRATSR